MLVVYKGNTTLKVRCQDQSVTIAPVAGMHDNARLLATIAKNEELLAQLFLNNLNHPDAIAQLAAYFMQRGWQVKQAG